MGLDGEEGGRVALRPTQRLGAADECFDLSAPLGVRGVVGRRRTLPGAARSPSAPAASATTRQDCHAGEEPAKPLARACLAIGPFVGLGDLAPRELTTGLEELALDVVEVVGVSDRPVQGGAEAGPAQQLGLVAITGRPRAGGVAEPLVQAAAFDVVLEPLAQARPLAQERFVAHLDGVLA